MDDLISIITPTFGGNPDKIRRCLNSVVRQSCGNFEQIVASDGTEEPAAREIVERFNDRRITYQPTKIHPGDWGNGVRQEVVSKFANGKYLVFLDDDNIIFPTYLEKC